MKMITHIEYEKAVIKLFVKWLLDPTLDITTTTIMILDIIELRDELFLEEEKKAE
jgi:hypothetical protein